MDVKELLEDKNIDYISKGRDYAIRCLNPEHEDSNPSMNIDKISGIFHCLSCGYSGDIYNYFNINKEKFINIKIQEVKEKIFKLMNTRSIPLPLDASRIRKEFRGIRLETLKLFGAFTTETLEGMEGRIVFPIFDINDMIVGFQGRYMYSELDPKYKFYPEHVRPPLYPAIVKPINNSIILVEGLFDMLNCHDKGLTNTVCTWGTAFGSVRKKTKIKNNIDKLLNYKYQGVDKLYIMYDGDEAGRKASANLAEYAKSSFSTELIELGDGQDPGNLTLDEIKRLYGVLYD